MPMMPFPMPPGRTTLPMPAGAMPTAPLAPPASPSAPGMPGPAGPFLPPGDPQTMRRQVLLQMLLQGGPGGAAGGAGVPGDENGGLPPGTTMPKPYVPPTDTPRGRGGY